MRFLPMRWLLSLAVVLGGVAGCSGDDGPDSPDSGPSTSTSPDTAVQPIGAAPAVPEPGTLSLVIGTDLRAELTIDACTVDAGAEPTGEVPAELVAVRASGTTAGGAPVNLDLRRFRSQGASATITDTVTVVVGDPEEPDVALVAQRFEVDGVVTDPRDPDADDPLVRVREGQIEAGGVFAPPGAFADDGGLVEGGLVARCE